MADNTTLNLGTGGDVIATDDVTTLNGAASTGIKVQRVKVGHGADGTHSDATVTNPLPVSPPPSNLVVSTSAAANTALTATLPAAGAGLFHYITGIELIRTATAALAGSATYNVTTTNLPGTLAWTLGNLMAAGDTKVERMMFSSPLKSSAANTATTIVAPAPGAGVLWRINVYYYTGA